MEVSKICYNRNYSVAYQYFWREMVCSYKMFMSQVMRNFCQVLYRITNGQTIQYNYTVRFTVIGCSKLASWWFEDTEAETNGRHLADVIFKCIFLNENVWIPIKISLKFVPKGPINNIPAMVQIMAWRRPGDKPLSEPMVIGLATHICVARPQWVY